MSEGPNFVKVAAMIGDHTRAAMLSALMSGEALTASELAMEAGITRQTASSHLAKLCDAGLISVASQGRHRYYKLADAEVAELMEKLMGVAVRSGARQVLPGPKDPQLRKARVCYDHLAGEMGVNLFDSFFQRNLISINAKQTTDNIELTNRGLQFFTELGIPTQVPKNSRRAVCRSCLDWSVRRHHLAGLIGASLLQHCFNEKWARRLDASRIVKFSPAGERRFNQVLLSAGSL